MNSDMKRCDSSEEALLVKRITFLSIYFYCFSHGSVFFPISLFFPLVSSLLAKVYPWGVLWGYLLDKPFEMHFLKNLPFHFWTAAISQNVLKKKCEWKNGSECFKVLLLYFVCSRKKPYFPRSSMIQTSGTVICADGYRRIWPALWGTSTVPVLCSSTAADGEAKPMGASRNFDEIIHM